MDPQVLFAISFPLAAPFWALMILAPGWSWTCRIVASPLIAVPASLVYAAVVLPAAGAVLPAVTSPTPSGIAAFLATPAGATAGWAHFVAFDLFVGAWIYRDARDRTIPALLTAPVLVLTILLAPLGLLAHLTLRAVVTRRRRPLGNAASTPAAVPTQRTRHAGPADPVPPDGHVAVR